MTTVGKFDPIFLQVGKALGSDMQPEALRQRALNFTFFNLHLHPDSRAYNPVTHDTKT